MEKMVTILQRISQTAFKTQETVKTMASYPETYDIFNKYPLYKILNDIQTNSIRSTFKVITKGSRYELTESLKTIFRSMDSCIEMYYSAKVLLPSTVPENLKEWLDKNLISLKNFMIELTSHIERIYGKEAKQIVSSAFKDLSNLEV